MNVMYFLIFTSLFCTYYEKKIKPKKTKSYDRNKFEIFLLLVKNETFKNDIIKDKTFMFTPMFFCLK